MYFEKILVKQAFLCNAQLTMHAMTWSGAISVEGAGDFRGTCRIWIIDAFQGAKLARDNGVVHMSGFERVK